VLTNGLKYRGLLWKPISIHGAVDTLQQEMSQALFYFRRKGAKAQQKSHFAVLLLYNELGRGQRPSVQDQ
jgi:hypothetical protein